MTDDLHRSIAENVAIDRNLPPVPPSQLHLLALVSEAYRRIGTALDLLARVKVEDVESAEWWGQATAELRLARSALWPATGSH